MSFIVFSRLLDCAGWVALIGGAMALLLEGLAMAGP
jgi:hypothetical protein